MRKTQILTWAVVLLLVTNAVTIGTIFYHNYRESKKSDDVVIAGSYGGNMINGNSRTQARRDTDTDLYLELTGDAVAHRHHGDLK